MMKALSLGGSLLREQRGPSEGHPGAPPAPAPAPRGLT